MNFSSVNTSVARWGAGMSLITAGAVVAVWSSLPGDPVPPGLSRTNGRIEVERIEIAAKYPGRVNELPAQEGDLLNANDIIARQDTAELQAQLAAAEAARQRAIQAIARATAETEGRKVQTRLAELELGHAMRLRSSDLVSDAEVERRQAQRDGEQAGISAAKAAIGEADAARQETEAQIQRINVAIEDMTVRAPVAGRLEYRVVEPGSVVPSGGRLATLLNLSDVYMTVFLPNAVAGKLRIGDEARIVLDAAPQFVVPARVSFVAAEAQFTPKYVETSSERDKLMYRVKLKVPVETTKVYSAYIKAGMTGNGYVRVNPETAWPAELAIKLPQP